MPRYQSGHQKLGGRTKGTPNKLSTSVLERLDEMGCDPLAFLDEQMRNEENRMDLRCKCAAVIMEYAYPKRRAVDAAGNAGADATQEITIQFVRQTMLAQLDSGVPKALEQHFESPQIGAKE